MNGINIVFDVEGYRLQDWHELLLFKKTTLRLAIVQFLIASNRKYEYPPKELPIILQEIKEEPTDVILRSYNEV